MIFISRIPICTTMLRQLSYCSIEQLIFNTVYWIFCYVPCQRLMEFLCALLIKTNKTSLRPPVFVITNRCIIVECMTPKKNFSFFIAFHCIHLHIDTMNRIKKGKNTSEILKTRFIYSIKMNRAYKLNFF